MKHLSALAIVLLCAISLTFGQGPRENRGKNHSMERGFMPPNLAELNLTDAQKTQLKAHHEKNAETFIDMRANMKKAELRLRQALETLPIDETALKNARADILKNQTLQIDSRIAHMRYFLSVLTPEQHAKFKLSMNNPDNDMGKENKKDRKGRGNRQNQ